MGPGTTPETGCRALAEDADVGVREAVAAHPATPPDVLLRLAADPAVSVRMVLVRETSQSAVIERLADDPDPFVRLALLEHPELPLALLARSARDACHEVRAAVADHRDTPAETLLALAADPHPAVREVVAMRPDLTADALRVLGAQRDPIVDLRLRERAPRHAEVGSAEGGR